MTSIPSPRTWPTLILVATTAITLGACARHPASLRGPAWVPALVALSVPDLDRSVAWYRDTLDFALERRMDFPEHGVRIALIGRDDVRFELVELRGSRPRGVLVPGTDNPAAVQGFGKVGFRVAEVDSLAARLARRGVRFQVTPRDDLRDRTRSFIILDPDGNWLQFSASPPGSD